MENALIGTEEFLKKLTKEFPEIEAEVRDEDYKGFLVLQVGVFTNLTQAYIDKDDLIQTKKCILFISSVIKTVEFKVENSIIISWLGKLNFDNNPEAKALLPVEMLNDLEALLRHQHDAKNDPIP